MKKVLIPTKLDTVAADILRAHGGYDVVQDDKTPFAELVAANPDTYAIIVRSEPVGAETFEVLPSLKVVIRAGAGFNTIDSKAAQSASMPGACNCAPLPHAIIFIAPP